jgi:hypothetical protein
VSTGVIHMHVGEWVHEGRLPGTHRRDKGPCKQTVMVRSSCIPAVPMPGLPCIQELQHVCGTLTQTVGLLTGAPAMATANGAAGTCLTWTSAGRPSPR